MPIRLRVQLEACNIVSGCCAEANTNKIRCTAAQGRECRYSNARPVIACLAFTIPCPRERTMKIDAYDELARAVGDAGFYTNGVEVYEGWHRTTVCSKRGAISGALGGNSFWVSRMQDGWYVGTWGGDVFRLPNRARIAELCIDWLSSSPNGTSAHFDEWVISRFGLIPVPADDTEMEADAPD